MWRTPLGRRHNLTRTERTVMTRDQLAADTADTITALNETCRTLTTLGRFADLVDAASALAHAANAYDLTARTDEDDD